MTELQLPQDGEQFLNPIGLPLRIVDDVMVAGRGKDGELSFNAYMGMPQCQNLQLFKTTRTIPWGTRECGDAESVFGELLAQFEFHLYQIGRALALGVPFEYKHPFEDPTRTMAGLKYFEKLWGEKGNSSPGVMALHDLGLVVFYGEDICDLYIDVTFKSVLALGFVEDGGLWDGKFLQQDWSDLLWSLARQFTGKRGLGLATRTKRINL